MDIKGAIKKVIGSQHERKVRKLQPLVDEINELCEELAELSDEEFKAKTAEFRKYISEQVGSTEDQIRELRAEKARSTSVVEREVLSVRLQDLDAELSEQLDEALDDLLPEAFAAVKETCRRLVGTELIVSLGLIHI